MRLQSRDAFSSYHPAVNFLYFGLVLFFTMCFLHPACLLLSLAAALRYAVCLNGRRAVRRSLRYLLPAALLAALINPAFNHQGATILTYLPSGNPLTLESIAYGLAAASLLSAVVTWFSCYTAVMTSDKFVYLFGRVIPALSLVLSMALRFVPRFQVQARAVSQAQRCVGRDVSDGSLLQRLRNGVTILSILLTWCLENALETADSMKSRGYGLPGRTAFSIYRLDDRDQAALWWLGALGGYILSMWGAGGFACRYFPTFRLAPRDGWSLYGLLAFGLLCLTPVIIDRREDRQWTRLRSMT